MELQYYQWVSKIKYEALNPTESNKYQYFRHYLITMMLYFGFCTDKLFNNENFERGIPSNENTNKMVTISETKSSVNEMDQAKPLAKEDIYDDEGYNKVTFAHVTFTAMEVLLIIVSGFIVGIYLTRYCLRLQPFQAMTRFTIPYSNPIYHK